MQIFPSKTFDIDVGLNHFYTDSNGETVAKPRHLRKSYKSLKRLQGRLSKTKKGSKNRDGLTNKLARAHLKVSRCFVKTLLLRQQGA